MFLRMLGTINFETKMKLTIKNIFVIVFILTSMISCINSDCSTNFYRQSCSPNGQAQACCYFTDCGATTGGPFTISLVEGCDSLPDLENSIYIFTHDNPVSFNWISDDSLNIQYYGNPFDIDYKDYITINKGKERIWIVYDKK